MHLTAFWDIILRPMGFSILIVLILMYLLFMKYSNHVKFIFQIIINFTILLFKKDKSIIKNELHFSYKSVFSNSYIIIKFDFDNVIWFNFEGITIKPKNGEIVFDFSNLSKKEIKLITQGLFRKKEYKIEIPHAYNLNSKNFILELRGTLTDPILFSPFLFEKKVTMIPRSITFNKSTPSIKQQDINIKLNSYNQNNFI
jgi:hypothetical protein